MNDLKLIFEIFFNIYFLISLFLISIMLFSEIAFFVQQEGYSVKSIFKYFFIKVKENILNLLMVLIIIVCMWIFDFDYNLFIFVYLIIQTSIWIWAGNQFVFLQKVKFTKRIKRQFFVQFLLLIIVGTFLLYVNKYLIVIFFPLIFVLQYFLYMFNLIILMPIEKLIGNYFLKNAKRKLKSNNKLIKIGITGSYGKTSTKEILNSILSQEYFVLATPKSFNTPFGISKTINENLKNTHQVFICEMGAKKKGEIKELCELVQVDAGIVTSVGRQHLETFGNIETVYQTKKELPDFLYQKVCVFNLMNNYVASMFNEYLYTKIGIFILQKRLTDNRKKCKFLNKKIKIKFYLKVRNKIFYEYIKNGNVYAKKIKITSNKSTFDIWFNDKFICSAETSLIGIHNIINILLAVAMAIILGVSQISIKIGVNNLKKINARFEKHQNQNGAIVINNGYNSNLDSASYSLKALNLFDNKNKLVITPGLIECKDMYIDNFLFGKLIGKYCTEIIIVKNTNKYAILDGLKSINFDISKIHFAESFNSVRKLIESLNESYVVLIENDLPENYK